MSIFQFVGAPCLQHTNYVFYKAFKYKLQNRSKILFQGDFFFLKILQEISICIAEVELLWEDKASSQLLSSLRLYFRPEHTPDGRQDDSGQDEVLALGERIVLRLDDLVPLIREDVKWTYGSCSPCRSSSSSSNSTGSDSSLDVRNGNSDAGDSKSDVKKSEEGQDGGTRNGFVVKEENGCNKIEDDLYDGVTSGAANIAVMNYARYCRYRAMCRRLEGCESVWLHVAVVVAIGGYSSRRPGCRVMFCRDTFYQAEIDDWDCRMDHMLPMLKSRGKTKKSKLSKKDSPQDSDSMEEMFANVVPSISSSSRPRRLAEPGEMSDHKVSTHEQAFLIGLHKFMHDAKMPIGRIPSLGFKQIDLYYFYKQADKLGGYDSITHKRMWKHLYDKLGGNSSNTSAATCTRKHYERLLLPYERHLRKLKNAKLKKHGGQGDDKKDDKKGSHTSQKEEDIKRQSFSETSNVSNEQKHEKDRQKGLSAEGRQSSEHSKYQNVDTEVLEIPVVRHRTQGANGSSSKNSSSSGLPMGFPPCSDLQGMNGLSYAQLEQLQQQALQAGDPAAAALYANMVYQGGYLLPMLPPHLLQSQWGLLAHPPAPPPHSSSSSAVAMSSHLDSSSFSGPSPAKKANQKDCKSSAPGSSSSKNHHPSTAHHSNPALSSGSSAGVKPAHSNTPYIPSPYLLNDHIQASPSSHTAPRKSHPHPSSSLHYLGASASAGLFDVATSQHLAFILHPTPSGQRGQTHLPPAPDQLYLDPVSTNPFSPVPAPISGAPPAAHSFSRKRSYPFVDSPGGGAFPSPDMVLNRIKNSTGLPRCGNATYGPTAVHSNSMQRFDNPRDILQHTQQSFLASQASGRGYHKQAVGPPSGPSKPQGSKSKNGSKRSHQSCSTAASAYSPSSSRKAAGSEVNSSLSLQQQAGKQMSSSNGYLPHQHLSKDSHAPGLILDPTASSSGKDGRLTSALFGSQFTAMPRSTKPSDPGAAYTSDPSSLMASTSSPPLSSSSSSASVSAAVAAALSMNPHLHPAFLSPFLPSASGPASSASPGVGVSPQLNSQLQMLVSAYGTTPAQLAAYEEMLRQNFVLPPPPGLPNMSSSSPHHPAVAVASAGGMPQQSKGSKKH